MASTEARALSGIGRKLLGCGVVILGALLLAYAWTQLAPRSAPQWLNDVVEAVSPTVNVVADGEPIEVAVAVDGPFGSGSGASIVNSVRMAFNELNARGGLEGRPLVVRVYDDQGDAARAVEVAQQIVESDAVAVIGHRTSTMSAAAGPIYKAGEIPAITPTSTSPVVTADNAWYFRTIGPDDRLGHFLAHYVQVVERPSTTLLVTEDNVYGLALSQSFTERAETIGLNLLPTFTLQPPRASDSETAEADATVIQSIVSSLQQSPGRNAIFFAMYPERAIAIVKAIRDAGITNVSMLGPDSFDTEVFTKGFDDFPQERRSPGFYTDNFTVATPLVYDTAGRQAGIFYNSYSDRFGSSPDWRAAFGYDAAKVVETVLAQIESESERSESGQAPSTADVRNDFRRRLSLIRSPRTAVAGVTGPVFFDTNGDSQRIPSIARMEANQLVSALTQFNVVESISRANSVENMIQQGRVIDLDGILMERADVVFTGVSFDSINNIDEAALTADVTGSIWFRYHPDTANITHTASEDPLTPAHIMFLNAAGDVTQSDVVAGTTRSGTHYHRVDFSGPFNLDFVPSVRRYGEPTIGLAFRHVSLPTSGLIYVVDIVGMGLTGGRSFRDQLEPIEHDLANAGWDVVSGAVYRGTIWTSSLGDPAFLGEPSGQVPYSAFYAIGQVSPHASLGTALVPDTRTVPVFLIAGVLFLVTILWFLFLERFTGAFVPLVAQAASLALIIWLGERIVIDLLQDRVPFQQLAVIGKVFAVAWWLLPAYYLVRFLHDVVWAQIEKKSGRAVPGLIKNLDRVIIYGAAIFGVLAFVLDQPITSLLATTGLLGLIIGLAVQGNLANIFSGLTLSMERPFAVGDIVEIAGQGKAEVQDMTWRSVRLGTSGSSRQTSIPNSDVAGSVIINHTRTQPANCFVEVRLPAAIPPAEAIEVITNALGEIDLVRHDTLYGASFAGLKIDQDQWYGSYSVYWKMEKPHKDFLVMTPLWAQIWEVFGDRALVAIAQQDAAGEGASSNENAKVGQAAE